MTGFFRVCIALALCALASGCITSAEQQAKRNIERCAARGYQPDSPDFKDCIARVDNEHDARMQQRRQELLEKSGAPASNRGY